jgi:hypothetical protein
MPHRLALLGSAAAKQYWREGDELLKLGRNKNEGKMQGTQMVVALPIGCRPVSLTGWSAKTTNPL